MKTFRNLCMAAALLLAAFSTHGATVWPHGLGIGGADENSTGFGGKGAVQAAMASSGRVTNTAWFVTSAKAMGIPRITFIDATTDRAGEEGVEFWTSTNSVTCTNSSVNANTNKIICSATNGLTVADVCILRGVTNDWYQFLTISNFSGTEIHFYQTISNIVQNGDILYEMTSAGKLNFWASQNAVASETYTNFPVKSKQFSSASPTGLFQGKEGSPLMVTVTSSNAVSALNAVNGEHWRRPRP
jgi:hypothetical protein